MANDNIFQQYLQPARSIMDYQSDYDKADARKQDLAQNALTLAAGRQKFDEGVQSTQRAAQLRAALTGLAAGATDDDRISAMRGTGSPEGFAAADTLDKSLIERRKGAASAGKDEAETAKANQARNIALHEFHAQKLATVQTPQDALAWAQEGQQLGVFSQPGQYERGVEMIQQAAADPKVFADWKHRAMQGGQSVTEQLKQQLEQVKQAEQVRQFGATDRRIQSEGAAGRAVTMRGQNMTDSRARESRADSLSKPFEVTGADGMPVLVQQSKAGIVPVQGYSPKRGPEKPLNDSQSKALLFGTRMQEADKVLADLAVSGTATSVPGSRAPLIGGGINAFSGENQQMLDQAKRDFLNAVLRRESGAAIGPSEFENGDKQYFPQIGESKKVHDQKARNRQLAISGVLVEVPEKRRTSITPKSPGTAPAATDIHSQADAILRGGK